jgi:hypothetical protein
VNALPEPPAWVAADSLAQEQWREIGARWLREGWLNESTLRDFTRLVTLRTQQLRLPPPGVDVVQGAGGKWFDRAAITGEMLSHVVPEIEERIALRYKAKVAGQRDAE